MKVWGLCVLIIMVVSIMPVFAQTDEIPFLTVKTDDNHYDEGDTIVISGQLRTVIPQTPIILQVFFEENLIDVAQFFPAQDGSYSHTILAEKPSWKKEGEYLIRVSHGEGNISETTITFTPKKEFLETEDSYEVEIPSGGTFDLEYSILGGKVVEMYLEPDDFTLGILLEAPDEGSLTLRLLRESIDALKPNGQDEKFIVLIDDIQFPYQETETNSQSRLITINFNEGDSEIKIIGTRVVPEFGVMTFLVFLVGITITIFVCRYRMPLQTKI